LGEPPVTLRVRAGREGVPAEQESWRPEGRCPSGRTRQTGTQTEQRSKGSNGEREAKPSKVAGGSLSVLVVPTESRETGPREPASREGGRRVMESVLGHTTDTTGIG
jgi:hypothetical protein